MSRAKPLRAPSDVSASALPAARTSRREMWAMVPSRCAAFAPLLCAPLAPVWRADPHPSPHAGRKCCGLIATFVYANASAALREIRNLGRNDLHRAALEDIRNRSRYTPSGVEQHLARHRRGRVRLDPGPLGLRQVDAS